MTTVPVVIVGAGPTGVTAALLLARRGITGLVLERHRGIYPQPRAVHLDDEGVRILQQVGLDGAFAAISRPAPGLRLLDAHLRPFAVFDRDRPVGHHGHPEANLFDQPELEEILRGALARCDGMTLRGGVEVTAVEQPDGGPAPVRVTLRDLGTGEVEQVWCQALLGCDGAASTVRDAIGARLRDLHFTERWFVVDVRCAATLTDWGGVDQVCDPRRAATFMRLAGDRYRWEFRMRGGETAEALAGRVPELTARWTADAELEVLRATDYTFRARIADRWRSGRVFLLGDAAHLTPPFIGQGLCSGLRDAHNLAWKLASVLDGDPDGEHLLDSYQAERAPHAEAMIRGAVRIGRAMTGGQDTVAFVRRAVLAAVLRIPGASRRAAAVLPTRYAAGPAVDRRRHRRDLTGQICPQHRTSAGPLDDLLGDGWALVADGPLDGALAERARQRGARTVLLGDLPDAGPLRRWMRRGRAGAVLLRPDRVVLATARKDRDPVPGPTLDLDLYGRTVLADPLPHYAALRAAGPAVWLPRNKLWVVARHADVKAALKDAETLRSGTGVGANRLINRLSGHTVLNSDGDVHTARRRVLLRSLGPRHLTGVEDRIRDRAEAAVARLLAAPSGFDGVTDFAAALPVEVVADLVGLRVDAARLLHWGRTTFDALGPSNLRALRATPGGLGLARRTARLKRSDVVPGSWAAAVFAAADAGDITERDARTMVVDFVVPSLDTTILATAHLLWCLGTVPGAWEELRADPSLIPAAVVEAVRLASPVRGFTRLVARDTGIGGVPIRAGQRVVLLYAAANRDERAFDRPDEFDLHRDRHDQLGWGHGPHTCVGMHLAKLEMGALLRAMVPTVGEIRVGAPTPMINNVLQGFATLPARVVPLNRTE